MPATMHSVLAVMMIATAATAQGRLPAVQLPALPLQTLPQTLDQVGSQSLDRSGDLRHLEIGRLVAPIVRFSTRIRMASPSFEMRFSGYRRRMLRWIKLVLSASSSLANKPSAR